MPIFTLPLESDFPPVCQGGAVTLGNFDGVHLGHQLLLTEAMAQAKSLGGPSLAITFDPHPLQLLRPQSFQPVLTTMAYRTALLQNFGVDHVLVLQTCPALLQLSAREFFEQVMCQKLKAQAVVEGMNFGFGRQREGNVQTLQMLGQEAGVKICVVPPFEWAGSVVSSSRVRHELEAGRVAVAHQLMGRPYRISGVVVPGKNRGQQLGFPTANLDQMATLFPADGVYAGKCEVQAKSYRTAIHLGPNSTFGEKARQLEVHLLDFAGDLYGQTLGVDFLHRLRATQPFASVDDLIRQLHTDIAQVRTLVFCPD